jgi:methylmalonyl-CoA mutase N-terminal domain/subunit
MRERFGATNPRSWMLRFHTQTGGVTLTAQQPDNNVVRVTLQALAAVLGGTQSLHTNSRDEALALPTEDAVRVALRTQQILAYESGVASTVDPLGGSYVVEKLTDELEAEAAAYIETIDRLGGMVAAIEQGYVQREIEASSYAYGQAVERGERVVVGVNRFQSGTDAPPELLRIDDLVAARQTEKLARVRRERDGRRVARALTEVGQAARGTENLMPALLEAVRSYASIGEICGALRRVFGEYEESFVR